MRLGISGLFLKPAQVGGVEFVLRALLHGLVQLDDVEVYLFLPNAASAWPDTLPETRDRTSANLQVIPLSMRGNRFLSESLQLPEYSDRYQLDGILYPNYFTPWRTRKSPATVTIIHDLNYRHFPDLFSRRKRLWLNLAHRLTLSQANVTVTGAEFVRADIAQAYQLRSNHPLVAIADPILWQRFDTPSPPQHTIKQPFILSVANHYQHKNLRTLIQAFHQLPSDLADVNLVLVGQLPDSLVGMRRDRCDDIPGLVSELGLQHRVQVTGYISDSELAWYYRHAAAFVYPSLFEGFGLPPVEALGLGLPTLTTRCTAIPETTLGLAHYVDDPLSAAEFADCLTQMLRDRDNFVPSEAAIAQVRATYDPIAVARRYVSLFTPMGEQT